MAFLIENTPCELFLLKTVDCYLDGRSPSQASGK